MHSGTAAAVGKLWLKSVQPVLAAFSAETPPTPVAGIVWDVRLSGPQSEQAGLLGCPAALLRN